MIGAPILWAEGSPLAKLPRRFLALRSVGFGRSCPSRFTSELVGSEYNEATLQLAARLALSSRHPMATALAALAQRREPFEAAQEAAGLGVKVTIDGIQARLGSPRFCGAESEAAAALAGDPESSVICFRFGDALPIAYQVRQELREDAAKTVAMLKQGGYRVIVLSGDRKSAVSACADSLGISEWQGELTPQDKIARIESLKAEGCRVLMVGDGVNDAPAIAAADVSISPVTAAHISQTAADALFMGARLAPVLAALSIGAKAKTLMVQNLWFSALYNVAAVPLAAAGLLTPLIAALAMSGSSVAVTSNALRVRLRALRVRARRRLVPQCQSVLIPVTQSS
jgi:P-type Cu2+ transporter